MNGYGGNIGAALVLGGIDSTGPMLYSISPNGYSASPDFTSLGSGSIAAISILEHGFKKDMTKDEAIFLGAEAVKAGILNDLYSGSNVDVCIIDMKEGVDFRKGYLVVEKRKNDMEIVYPRNSVLVEREDIFKYVEEI